LLTKASASACPQHGSALALRNAIRAARTAVELQINTRIVEAMTPLHDKLTSRNTTTV
jgi:hypothetical protein